MENIFSSFEGNIFDESSSQPVGEASQNCGDERDQLPGLATIIRSFYTDLIQSYLKFDIPLLWGFSLASFSQLVSLDSLIFLCI